MQVPITSHKQKIHEAKRMFIFPHRTSKDNIRSVILDWSQRSAGLSSKGGDPLATQADLSAPPCVFSSCCTTLQKSPCHRRKTCVNSLWLYSYFTQMSLLKNKNINYVFIYLWVLRCLSIGTICNKRPIYVIVSKIIFLYFAAKS